MKNELRRIADAAWQIVADPRASRIERIEALKLVAACKGLLLSDINEQTLSVRQVVQLRQAKQRLVERALRTKERRRKQNRRAYLRQQLRKLQQQEEHGDTSTN